MKVYHYYQKQFIKADIDRVWDFFSSPINLNEITPPFMNFEILHTSDSKKMFEGQLITYNVSPFSFYRVRWVTEIKDIHPKKSFVDNQKSGPFSLWHHEHQFSEIDGGVEMKDHVSYALPFGFLGTIAHSLAVRKQVRKIFEYRIHQIEILFNK